MGGSKLARLVTEERPKGTTVCLHWQKLGPFTPFCETGPLKRQFFLLRKHTLNTEVI